uniref:Magnesium transporter MgtE intracellular domain-containing protein n=1 Tax=Ignavibacterium album TaxID=591197 RepID=A0A832G7I0_9BACT
MKSYILNTVPFLFAFIVVTGAIIYLNGQYNNIFQFDFSPRNQATNELKDSLNTDTNNDKEAKLNPPTEKNDSLQVEAAIKESGEVTLKTEDDLIKSADVKPDIKKISTKELEAQLEKKPEPEKEKIEQKFASNDLTQTQESKQQKQDSTYQNWLKKVSKLLEQMEPAKASKIIQNYSDNVARDIIYSMNKKSAAKIVSELSPEVAQRIIRYD